MSSLPPQIETAIVKVDAFMGKYPLICQDGALVLRRFCLLRCHLMVARALLLFVPNFMIAIGYRFSGLLRLLMVMLTQTV